MLLSFYPAQFLSFAVNLSILLYYKGANVGQALPEAWLSDERSRQHSDILILRSGRLGESLIWSPQNRPFGYVLPRCRCEERGQARWRLKKPLPTTTKPVSRYLCTECKSTLVVTQKPGKDFTQVEALGTVYVKCAWPVPILQTETQVFSKGEGNATT